MRNYIVVQRGVWSTMQLRVRTEEGSEVRENRRGGAWSSCTSSEGALSTEMPQVASPGNKRGSQGCTQTYA